MANGAMVIAWTAVHHRQMATRPVGAAQGDAAPTRRMEGDYSLAVPSIATFARDRFASLLGGAATAGSFSARRTARPHDLRLEVDGVGPIALPVSVRQA